MAKRDLSGYTALVTGASSGIGAAIARRLAARKCDLVVTARRVDRLNALAAEVGGAHGVSCRVVPEDLSDPKGPARLYQRVMEGGASIDILVNDAGFGSYQAFLDTPWQRHAQMLQVNLTSLSELTHRFLPHLLERPHRTHVLNLGSLGAWVAMPYFATYDASKAYVVSFSTALAAELARTNVRVTCLCPGNTATEFQAIAGQHPSRVAQATSMTADRVAAIGIKGMLRGRRIVVPGGTNKFTRLLLRLFPHTLVGRAAARLLGAPAPRDSLAALPPWTLAA
jgi:uncharacterized protein